MPTANTNSTYPNNEGEAFPCQRVSRIFRRSRLAAEMGMSGQMVPTLAWASDALILRRLDPDGSHRSEKPPSGWHGEASFFRDFRADIDDIHSRVCRHGP